MKINTIESNFLYNLIYQILTIIIPIITTPYISRTIGANGLGIYSYNYSIASYFVMFILLGVNNYGNREIAKCRNNKETLRKTFWSIYAMQFLLGIVIILTYFFYCFQISSDFNISIIMITYVISGIFDINWLFFGLEKFKFTVIRNVLIKVLSTIFIFIFVNSVGDSWKYCLILSLGMFASQIVLWPFIIKEIPLYVPRWKEIAIHIRPNLYLFLSVIAVSIFKTMDKIMLGILTNQEQVGFYDAAEKIISIPTAVINSLGIVMLPHMSNMVVAGNKNENGIIEKSLLLAMLMASSMCFGIMGISKEFVPLFYGNGFSICITLYLILLPSCLFLSFANVIRTQYLLPHNYDRPIVISAFLGAGVNFVINIILIPNLGAIGAAIGTLIAEAFVCIYQVLYAKKYIPIKEYYYESLAFILPGILMFISLYSIPCIVENNIINLILKIFIGALLYIIYLFFMLKIIFPHLHDKIKNWLYEKLIKRQDN